MTHGNVRTYRPWFKCIALVVLLAFVVNTVAWADGQGNIVGSLSHIKKFSSQRTVDSIPEIFSDIRKLSIPSEIGEVKSQYQGIQDRIVIHIQDAHVNEEAQKNIARIIEALTLQAKVKLVGVEGASGEVDTALFSAFPDVQAKTAVAGHFLKKGILTGPQYAAVTKLPELKLFGAEDPALYEENRKAFLDALSFADKDQRSVGEIRERLDQIARFVFSEDLRTLREEHSGFTKRKEYLGHYVKYLVGLSDKLKISRYPYRQIESFLELISLERDIDFESAEKEIDQLILDLRKILSREELSEFVTNSIQFRLKKMTRSDYYGYLQEKLSARQPEAAKYQNVLNYLSYIRRYDSIGVELFDEIGKLEETIKNKLFRNDQEVTLDRLYRFADLLEHLFDFSLTKEDADYFYAYRSELKAETFRTFIEETAKKSNQTLSLPSDVDVIDGDIPKIERFYKAALERDGVLIQKLYEKMAQSGEKVSVIVTGGFHTAGIERFLKEKDVSYLVIAPRITKEIDKKKEEALYEAAMKNVPTKLETMLSEIYLPPKSTVMNDPRYQLGVFTTLFPHGGLAADKVRHELYLMLWGPFVAKHLTSDKTAFVEALKQALKEIGTNYKKLGGDTPELVESFYLTPIKNAVVIFPHNNYPNPALLIPLSNGWLGEELISRPRAERETRIRSAFQRFGLRAIETIELDGTTIMAVMIPPYKFSIMTPTDESAKLDLREALGSAAVPAVPVEPKITEPAKPSGKEELPDVQTVANKMVPDLSRKVNVEVKKFALDTLSVSQKWNRLSPNEKMAVIDFVYTDQFAEALSAGFPTLSYDEFVREQTRLSREIVGNAIGARNESLVAKYAQDGPRYNLRALLFLIQHTKPHSKLAKQYLSAQIKSVSVDVSQALRSGNARALKRLSNDFKSMPSARRSYAALNDLLDQERRVDEALAKLHASKETTQAATFGASEKTAGLEEVHVPARPSHLAPAKTAARSDLRQTSGEQPAGRNEGFFVRHWKAFLSIGVLAFLFLLKTALGALARWAGHESMAQNIDRSFEFIIEAGLSVAALKLTFTKLDDWSSADISAFVKTRFSHFRRTEGVLFKGAKNLNVFRAMWYSIFRYYYKDKARVIPYIRSVYWKGRTDLEQKVLKDVFGLTAPDAKLEDLTIDQIRDLQTYLSDSHIESDLARRQHMREQTLWDHETHKNPIRIVGFAVGSLLGVLIGVWAFMFVLQAGYVFSIGWFLVGGVMFGVFMSREAANITLLWLENMKAIYQKKSVSLAAAATSASIFIPVYFALQLMFSFIQKLTYWTTYWLHGTYKRTYFVKLDKKGNILKDVDGEAQVDIEQIIKILKAQMPLAGTQETLRQYLSDDQIASLKKTLSENGWAQANQELAGYISGKPADEQLKARILFDQFFASEKRLQSLDDYLARSDSLLAGFLRKSHFDRVVRKYFSPFFTSNAPLAKTVRHVLSDASNPLGGFFQWFVFGRGKLFVLGIFAAAPILAGGIGAIISIIGVLIYAFYSYYKVHKQAATRPTLRKLAIGMIVVGFLAIGILLVAPHVAPSFVSWIPVHLLDKTVMLHFFGESIPITLGNIIRETFLAGLMSYWVVLEKKRKEIIHERYFAKPAKNAIAASGLLLDPKKPEHAELLRILTFTKKLHGKELPALDYDDLDRLLDLVNNPKFLKNLPAETFI